MASLLYIDYWPNFYFVTKIQIFEHDDSPEPKCCWLAP